MKMMQQNHISEDAFVTGAPELPALGILLTRAWPTGISDEEASLLRKLPFEDETLVRIRLSSLLEVDAGTRPASRPPEHDPRGLTASGFQSLVRRWRSDRSVQTLLPYAGRTPRRRDDTPSHETVSHVIDEMLAADPRASLVTISKNALQRSGVQLAVNTVRSLARERRMAMRSDPAWLAENYGHHMLADVCALGSTVATDHGDVVAVIALLVESASGIVLGHAVGPVDASFALQRSAIADGLVAIVGDGIDVIGDFSSVLTIVAAAEAPENYATSIRRASPHNAIVDSDRRRPGDRVSDLLDGAIDVLPLRPRGGRAARRSQNARWDPVRLATATQEAIDAHNRDRLALLRAAVPDNRLGPMGRMVEALRPVVDLA